MTQRGASAQRFERALQWLAWAMAGLMTLAAIAYALDVPRRLSLALYTEQYLALILALTLGTAFLKYPAFKGRLRLIDLGCALAGFGAAFYIALFYPVLVNELVYRPLDGKIISVVIALLTIEAVRRATGWGLTVVVAAFMLYGLFGHLLPFAMSRQLLWDRLFIYVVADTNGMLGLPLMVASIVVYAFILMGQVLQASGGSAFFNDLAMAVVGRAKGGAAKIAVVSSFLFGSVSGSAVANVVASGVVTIPMMKRSGYSPKFAAATESLASTGGQLAPPIMGAAAFLMAEFLQISYATVVLAAVIPTALYYFSIFLYVHIHATAQGLTIPEDVEIPRVRDVLRDGWHFILPFVVLIGTLFWLNWRPELSALAAAGSLTLLALVVPYRGAKASVRDLLGVIPGTGFGVVEIIAISAAAGMVIGVLNITGLSFSLTLQLVQMAAGNLFVLLLIAALVSIVLGMGMPTVGVYVLLASLIGPALVRAGIDPIAAHMFLLYFGMLSMITPPVALASFTAAAISGSKPMETGFQAVKMGWVAYLIPFMVVLEPGLVMQGAWQDIAWNGAGAIAGIVFATGAIYGYIWRPLRLWERAALIVLGIVALLPVQVIAETSHLPNALALALGGALLLYIRRPLAMA
ncbi:TRAP transporter permease [Pararhodobacter marinus]|uniref:TRAP transporter permease n=1 Tax=Pararhodobacter marinus TaxID=2184063 RepID=UPI003513FE7D